MARSGVEHVARTVDVRLKGHSRLVELAELRQGHDLEAAGIGQDRPRPVHEAMQAAEFGDALGAGAQHEMISIGQNDVGTEGVDLARMHSFDGRGCSHGHERRGADQAAFERDHTASRGAVRCMEIKSQRLNHVSHAAPDRGGRRRHSCRTGNDFRSRGDRHPASYRVPNRRRPT